ncbi:hypothetical protein OGAPHI_006774 [Ogataea philodendri]|uniref:Uncharacterized protein n=1 Tax=Ogataea philodendri TaxID=1378263 RepID=A0A9P8NXH1_9ASCO|nr:uncharacterized protein OGAPHI_006774 [Ogataea philodendri]KAH3661367.1 hypothetical protein OGAPHI_006774 [Ogataea philodendri]
MSSNWTILLSKFIINDDLSWFLDRSTSLSVIPPFLTFSSINKANSYPISSPMTRLAAGIQLNEMPNSPLSVKLWMNDLHDSTNPYWLRIRVYALEYIPLPGPPAENDPPPPTSI